MAISDEERAEAAAKVQAHEFALLAAERAEIDADEALLRICYRETMTRDEVMAAIFARPEPQQPQQEAE